MVAPRMVKTTIVETKRIFMREDENVVAPQVAKNSLDQSKDILLNSNPVVMAPKGSVSYINRERIKANRIVEREATASNSSIFAANCRPKNRSPSCPTGPCSSSPM
jgi:hypothetical protein